MTDKLKQIIKEEMAKLQKEAQEAINSLDWGSITEEIGKKYLLNESEINDLQVETLLVLVGLEEWDAYARNIENNVGTSKNEAEKIMGEADQRIFTPIYNFASQKIKEGVKGKKIDHEQNLDFILSGGDYSAFMEKAGETEAPEIEKAKPVGTSSLQDIKDKLIDINKK